MVCLFLGCKCRRYDRTWDEPIAATCLQSAFESAPSVSGKMEWRKQLQVPKYRQRLTLMEVMQALMRPQSTMLFFVYVYETQAQRHRTKRKELLYPMIIYGKMVLLGGS